MTVRRHPNAGIPMIHISVPGKGVRTQAPNILNVTGTRKTIKIINVAKSMIMAIVFVSKVLIPLFYHHFTIVNFQARFWIPGNCLWISYGTYQRTLQQP